MRKRTRLASQVQAIDAEIAERGVELGGMANAGINAAVSGGLATGGGRKRPRNAQNLADALADVLSKQTLSVTEVSEEVQRHGYKTTSPNFRTIVNQTLINDRRFKRVGRGLYTSKSSTTRGRRRKRS